jgi:hypothetical protein
LAKNDQNVLAETLRIEQTYPNDFSVIDGVNIEEEEVILHCPSILNSYIFYGPHALAQFMWYMFF